ncbi:MAG: hypothetical protein ACAF41_06505 [Leptolyngbya sp. BL-A-14]
MIDLSALLADAPLPDPTTLNAPRVHDDASIDHGGQIAVYIGLALFGLGITAVIGFLSRRVEYALLTALALSLGLVAVFAVTR